MTKLVLVHALSPIHCGTGQAVGGIDLPIARERPTHVPIIPGSSLKGVLRAMADGNPMQTAIFGPDTENAADHAGGVQFSDALLVFLPMRSVRGTFGWVTSPYLLRRLARDVAEAGPGLLSGQVRGLWGNAIPDSQARVAGQVLMAGLNPARVVFDDLDFAAEPSEHLTALANQVGSWLFEPADVPFFRDRVCMVSDDSMSLMLTTGMEITSRNRLNNETKTVAKGALWTEEALPVESILVGLATSTPVAQKDGRVPNGAELMAAVDSLVRDKLVQVGGNSTVGRGACQITLKGG